MNTSGQGCGFAFHQGNTHRPGWHSRWKGDFLIQHSPFTSSSWLRATSRGAIYLQVHSFFQQASWALWAAMWPLFREHALFSWGQLQDQQDRETVCLSSPGKGSPKAHYMTLILGGWRVRLTRMAVDLFSGALLVLLSLFSYLHSRKNSYSLFQPPLELEVSGRGSFGQWDRCA